jgi:DUF1009 family protein
MFTPSKRIGIVAGGGLLPKRLLGYCEQHDLNPFVVAFEGQADEELVAGFDHVVMRLGEAGKIIRLLKERGISDLIMIGSIHRPSARDLRPDLYTAAFFAKMGFKAMGDDSLLTAIRHDLERQGFTIHGIHEIIPEVLTRKGLIAGPVPNDLQQRQIEIGIAAARRLGEADVGQGVVVAMDGSIIEEDKKGTDALLRRAASNGAVLVKMCKPQQDRKLDLPTIGSNTVKLCAELGYAGIASEAGLTLTADEDVMCKLANQTGIFVVGV